MSYITLQYHINEIDLGCEPQPPSRNAALLLIVDGGTCEIRGTAAELIEFAEKVLQLARKTVVSDESKAHT